MIDETDALQRLLDAGGAVSITGNHYVDAVRGLRVRSDTQLRIDGTISAIPTAAPVYNIVLLESVSDVSIMGAGSIVGDKHAHLDSNPGRHGHCLSMFGSRNVTIEGPTFREAYADGLYVQDCTNTIINRAVCTDNSRNGLSIIGANGMKVTNSTFSLTKSESPMPQAGIDIEPDRADQSLLDITISGNRFLKNTGPGVYIAFDPAANRQRVFVVNNEYDQHYKDGCGARIGGRNTMLSNFLFATCRWLPTYDWWAYPRDFTLS